MFSLLQLSQSPKDYSDAKVLIPLSGGINSAAVLAYVGEFHPDELKPKELFLFYTHLHEHSPDTLKFVKDCVRYALRKFQKVTFKIEGYSVNEFFEQQKMIPHPTISPCSVKLKIEPREKYVAEKAIDAVLIGFVREEFRRYKRQQKPKYFDPKNQYPILEMTDANCFSLVEKTVGWYPAIYKIKERGRRVFTHNNCLPCKNMTAKQLVSVGKYFPEQAKRAEETAVKIPGAYWGRDDVADVFKCDVCTRLG